jgi:phenylacetate-CoA ligase
LKPKALIGYPSSLSSLSKLLDENNYKLCIPLAFTSSESIYSFQKSLIRESFGCKLYDWYGNAERSIALQEEFNEYKEPKLYSINEYHENHIITTSLINNSFPLIRYKVDDRLDIKNEKITAIVGRVDDVVILKDNTAIGRLDHLFKGVSGISYAQIIQEQINKIDINIVLNINQKFDSELLEKQIENWLGIDIVYQINFINEKQLVYMPSGKFKMVVSSVK